MCLVILDPENGKYTKKYVTHFAKIGKVSIMWYIYIYNACFIYPQNENYVIKSNRIRYKNLCLLRRISTPPCVLFRTNHSRTTNPFYSRLWACESSSDGSFFLLCYVPLLRKRSILQAGRSLVLFPMRSLDFLQIT